MASSTSSPRISTDLDLFASFVNSAGMAEDVLQDNRSINTADGDSWLREESSLNSQSHTDVAATDADLTETVDYSNNFLMKGFGYIFWVLIVVANAYALVELALGNTS